MPVSEIVTVREQAVSHYHLAQGQSSGSEAFRLEYSPSVSERALYNDIVSYLGEYRLQFQQYCYQLLYSNGSDGQIRLRDADQREAMVIKGQRGIQDRQRDGKPVDKFIADLVGIQNLERQLADAKDGDLVIWGSPPDPDMNFTYGFLYVGHVEEVNGTDKKLYMRAIRLDNNPTLEQYNQALSLITNQQINYSTPNEFIANPILAGKLEDVYVDFILAGTFDYHLDSTRQHQYHSIIQKMEGYIHDFIALVKNGASATQLVRAFYALENYALALKEQTSQREFSIRRNADTNMNRNHQSFNQMINDHGHKPAAVGGSCGNSDSTRSRDIFGSNSIFGSFSKDFSLSESPTSSTSLSSDGMRCVTCPFCSETVDAIVTSSSIECPSCHAKVAK